MRIFIFIFLLFLASAGHARADCTSPAGSGGSLVYNTTHHVVQYCDGADWIAAGPRLTGGTGNCASPPGEVGRIVFNTSHNVMQFCNGVNWVAMGPESPGGVGCSSPSGITAALVYNSTSDILQYCNGVDWIAIGKTPPDWTPDTFGFTDQTDVVLSTLTNSNIIQISGITGSVATSISGSSASYRTCSDAACSSVVTNWTTGAATIQNNQYVQLRLTSSASLNTPTSTDMTVGTMTRSWVVTTRLGSVHTLSRTPTSVSNMWVDGVTTGVEAYSPTSTITVTGVDPVSPDSRRLG